jgi:hypothetical protein
MTKNSRQLSLLVVSGVLMVPMYSRRERRQQLFSPSSAFRVPRAALVLSRHGADVGLVSIFNFF